MNLYTDGAFINGHVRYGFVIFNNDKIIKEFVGIIKSGKYLDHHQVTGELYAVIFGLRWCLVNGIKEINLYYDYDGIQKWANGLWKANKELTKKYFKLINLFKEKIKINFIKVKSKKDEKHNYIDKLIKSEV